MATRKSRLYAALKASGHPIEKHFRNYTIAELEDLTRDMDIPEPEPVPSAEAPVPQAAAPRAAAPKQSAPNPDEMAGQRLNTKDAEEVIRVDDQGRQWLQEEVLKPAFPKPRGRRILTYRETGTETATVQEGEYTETFEVAGKGPGRASEVKITLPSYQVGIYRDRRFPFRVHTYNGREGFNLFDVNDFYGGAELVPGSCKRVYVENVLCYDIRTVVQTINAEHRQLQLAGKI